MFLILGERGAIVLRIQMGGAPDTKTGGSNRHYLAL